MRAGVQRQHLIAQELRFWIRDNSVQVLSATESMTLIKHII